MDIKLILIEKESECKKKIIPIFYTGIEKTGILPKENT